MNETLDSKSTSFKNKNTKEKNSFHYFGIDEIVYG